jgi:hypothetical protein
MSIRLFEISTILVRSLSRPPFGIASRAFMTRFVAALMLQGMPVPTPDTTQMPLLQTGVAPKQTKAPAPQFSKSLCVLTQVAGTSRDKPGHDASY